MMQSPMPPLMLGTYASASIYILFPWQRTFNLLPFYKRSRSNLSVTKYPKKNQLMDESYWETGAMGGGCRTLR